MPFPKCLREPIERQMAMAKILAAEDYARGIPVVVPPLRRFMNSPRRLVGTPSSFNCLAMVWYALLQSRGDAAQHGQGMAIVVRIFEPGNNGLS